MTELCLIVIDLLAVAYLLGWTEEDIIDQVED